MQIQIDADLRVLAGWAWKLPATHPVVQAIKKRQSLYRWLGAPVDAGRLRLRDGRKKILVAKPLLDQDGPEIQRCNSRSHAAAVTAVTKDMQLGRDAGGDQGVVEVDAGADGDRLIVGE